MRGGVEHSLRGIYQSSPHRKYKHSLSCAVEGFLLKCKLEDLEPQTIEAHRLKLSRFTEYCIGCQLSEISPVIIREFLGYIKDKYVLDIATVQRHLVSIKAFFHWVCEEGFIVSNPTVGVRVGGLMKKVVRGLSGQDLKGLLDAVQDGSSVLEVRNKAMVYILVDCGLRISELVNLDVGDVDLKRGVLRVRGKGSKERLVRMGLTTQRALWEYTALRDEAINWIWVNKAGNKQDASGVQQWLRKLGEKIGIRLYPHLLRHTFAISFLRNGGNVFALQAALGHSSLEMTRQYCQALGFEDVFKEHEIASPIDNALKSRHGRKRYGIGERQS